MKTDKAIITFLFVLASLLSFKKECSAQTDSLYTEIDSALFITNRNSSGIKILGGGVTEIGLEQMQKFPKILGNTDPIRFVRNLPGVQTNSEYDSGIHIQGCDNSHNDINISGVPVYGISHLFGLFSTFNPGHYDRMSFSSLSESNRLGGTLKMDISDTLGKRISGNFSLSVISSQGSIGLKTGKRSHLKVSARQSYLNLLYKKWMNIGGSPIDYGFGDYNLCWFITPSDRDKIWIDAYFGQDDAQIIENTFNVGLGLKWRNYLSSLHWQHKKDDITYHQNLYFSGYDSHCILNQDISHISLDSYIKTAGLKSSMESNRLKAGLEITYFSVLPQNPKSDGLYGTDGIIQTEQNALETSIYAKYATLFGERWNLSASLRGNAYLSPEKQTYLNLSPGISASYNGFRYGKLSASYRINRQHLFQSGLSNIGLPIEFWFMAGTYSAPQSAHSVDFCYNVDMFNQALGISAEIYFKRLYNQVEYKGDLFDFFTSAYSLENHLLKGDGWNYGFNLMLHKKSGKVTGWISYSIGRALRRFENQAYKDIYPANHERIHELNTVCSYNLNNWNFSGTLVYAGGVPFTAPAYYYISAGQIITKPGEHNGCRMRPYFRMDLSATYSFDRKGHYKDEINISIYNATGRENEVMYRLNVKDGVYSYGPEHLFLRWIPSISYRFKF